MRAHHRVLLRRVLGPHLLLHLGRLVPPEGADEVVQADEPVDPLLGGVVEQVVGRAHVGPQRVAAERRQLDGAQHRSESTARAATSRRCARPRARGASRPRGCTKISGCSWSLGVSGCTSRSPNAPAERDVTVAVEAVLVAEEDHLPLEQRGADLRDRLGREVVGEVDPADLRADGRGHRFDRDASSRQRTARSAIAPRRPRAPRRTSRPSLRSPPWRPSRWTSISERRRPRSPSTGPRRRMRSRRSCATR